MGKTVDKATPVRKLPHLPPLSGSRRPPAPRPVPLVGGLAPVRPVGLSACGELRPHPAAFDPQAYTPISYHNLLAPGPAGLQAGQKVRVQAYFWQYLDYDPAMVRNYLTLLQYPIKWYRLQWFSTYNTADLTGYYDLAAVTPEQAEEYKLKCLDPVMLYGEMARLGPSFPSGLLYRDDCRRLSGRITVCPGRLTSGEVRGRRFPLWLAGPRTGPRAPMARHSLFWYNDHKYRSGAI